MKKTNQTIISKPWEALDIMLKLMLKQDKKIFQREHFKRMANAALRLSQYQTYNCKALVLDNEIVEINFALAALAELIPLPQ